MKVKSPQEDINRTWGQASSYAPSYNRALKAGEKGFEWLLVTNGLITALYPFDRGTPLVPLRLEDFARGSPPFITLKNYLKYKKHQVAQKGEILFERISPAELNKIFDQCHDLIWKKEKLSPTDAFYEFCKFIFMKIRQDKKRQGIQYRTSCSRIYGTNWKTP